MLHFLVVHVAGATGPDVPLAFLLANRENQEDMTSRRGSADTLETGLAPEVRVIG